MLKGADAEDGLWQKTDLATGNNILVVVAFMRRAIILYLLMVLYPCIYFMIVENSAIIFLWSKNDKQVKGF